MPTNGAHIDEGTIHAWLDGALGAAEAERVEMHVRGCRTCADAVAEARGLMAGASRIVGLLDEAPAPTIRATDRTSAWRFLRVTPGRAAIAAALVVAVGLTFTRPRAAVESTRASMDSAASVASLPPAMAPASPVAEAVTANATRTKDTLLASAVAKRIAMDHPAPVMRASPEPTVSASAPAPAAAVPMGREAASQVAGGVAAERRLDDARVSADKSRASAAGLSAIVSYTECYRVESSGPVPAEWKGVPLPFTIELGSQPVAGGKFGVTQPGGTRLIGSYRRSDDQIDAELVGETAKSSLVVHGKAAELSSSGRSVAVSVARVSCRP